MPGSRGPARRTVRCQVTGHRLCARDVDVHEMMMMTSVDETDDVEMIR